MVRPSARTGQDRPTLARARDCTPFNRPIIVDMMHSGVRQGSDIAQHPTSIINGLPIIRNAHSQALWMLAARIEQRIAHHHPDSVVRAQEKLVLCIHSARVRLILKVRIVLFSCRELWSRARVKWCATAAAQRDRPIYARALAKTIGDNCFTVALRVSLCVALCVCYLSLTLEWCMCWL